MDVILLHAISELVEIAMGKWNQKVSLEAHICTNV